MKYKIIFILILNLMLITSAYAQLEGLEWSKEYVLGPGRVPKLAINQNNSEIHICYINSFINPIYMTYAKLQYNDEHMILLEKENIPDSNRESGDWYGGGAIAVDPNGYPHIIHRRTKGSLWTIDIYYTKKTILGWIPRVLMKSDVYRAVFHDLAIDSLNRVHYIWGEEPSGYTTPYGVVNYNKIENNEVVKVHENFEPHRIDNSHAFDVSKNGTLHLLTSNFEPGGKLNYYISLDAGENFNLVEDIRNLFTDTNVRCGAPDMFTDQSGKVHITYSSDRHDSKGIPFKIQYVQYEDGLKTRHTTVAASGTDFGDLSNDYVWHFSSVAADDEGKNIAVIYGMSEESVDKTYGGPLYVKMSTNYGATWSEAELLSHSAGGFEGRNGVYIRSYKGVFFAAYSANDSVRIRAFPNNIDPNPVADAGGPYSGEEGDQILLDASASTDIAINAGIIEYAWDINNDGIFDIYTSSDQYTHTFPDNYTGPIILRVTDNNNQTAHDTTQANILNVNPAIFAGNDTTITEGTTLILHCEIDEPGSDITQCQWRVDGKQYTGTNLSYLFPDNDNLTFYITVQDDDGGIGYDTLNVTVENVAPVADAGGPYTGGLNVMNMFSGENSFDPGVNDNLIFQWDFTNDWIYDTTTVSPVRKYTAIGQYIINMKVTDKEGARDSTTTYITITNIAPEIKTFPDMSITEGSTFTPVDLTAYVIDPDQDVSTLTWQVSGYQELLVTLNDNILTVTPPDSEWAGSEILKLRVMDAGFLKDSTNVLFSVTSVNDAPEWIGHVPDTTFAEDDTIYFPISYLYNKVSDVDHSNQQLDIGLASHAHFIWSMDTLNDQLIVHPEKNWNGNENLVFYVRDPLLEADYDTSHFTITPVPDPPDTFSLVSPMLFESLVWPDTMTFKWNPTIDPDGSGGIIYHWELKNNVETLIDTMVNTTEITFIPNRPLDAGLYRWLVTAYDQNLDNTQSRNIGFIAIGGSGIEDINTSKPDHFALKPNYPNPFNPETKIEYHLADESDVHLSVYNQMGQIVRLLENSKKNAGVYTIVFNAKDASGRQLPSGIYIYKLIAGEHTFIRKMLLLQ